jgi:hypothetical protein
MFVLARLLAFGLALKWTTLISVFGVGSAVARIPKQGGMSMGNQVPKTRLQRLPVRQHHWGKRKTKTPMTIAIGILSRVPRRVILAADTQWTSPTDGTVSFGSKLSIMHFIGVGEVAVAWAGMPEITSRVLSHVRKNGSFATPFRSRSVGHQVMFLEKSHGGQPEENGEEYDHSCNNEHDSQSAFLRLNCHSLPLDCRQP